MRLQRVTDSAVIAGMAIALCALLAWLYGSTIAGLGIEWMSSPDASYGAILVAIALATIWTRRRLISAAASHATGFIPGVAVLGIGLLAFLIGRFGADIFVTRVSLVVVAAGLLWCLAGTRAARVCAAPLLLLLIAVPLPALIVNAVTMPMQLVASRMAEWMLAAAHIPVFRDGNVLELPTTSLEVADACSGLRSLISLTAIGCLVAWSTERKLLRRIVVILSALPIALLLNAVRIAVTGVACEVWGPAAAKGGWHTLAGWVTFVVAVLILARVQGALPGSSARARMTAPETVPA